MSVPCPLKLSLWTTRTSGRINTSRAKVVVAAAVVITFFLCNNRAAAIPRAWTGAAGTSSWNDPNNWNPVGVPGNGDVVSVPFITTANTNVTYDFPGNVILGALTLNHNNGPGAFATSILTMTGNTLYANSQLIADSSAGGSRGRGHVEQSGGTNTAPVLVLGKLSSNVGTYTLSGTGVLNSSDLRVGESGSGFLTQTGGTFNNANGAIAIGYSAGSNGTLTLSGGSLTSSGITIGRFGNGTVNHSAGMATLNAAGPSVPKLSIGLGTGTTGAYNLSGTGSLTVNNNGWEIVGDTSGAGTFTQTGGTNTLDNGPISPTDFPRLYVGASPAGGTYQLDGGSLAISNGQEVIGFGGGTGTFNQTSGTNSISNLFLGIPRSFVLGMNAGSTGTYNLTGGTFSCTDCFIGLDGGTGTFNHSAGNAGFAGAGGLTIVNGAYNLSGTGSLGSVEGFVKLDAPSGSSAVFNQTGGTFTLSGSVGRLISIGATALNSGTYTLNGGSASVKDIFVGGSDTGPGGTGTFTFNSPATLNVAGSITVYSGGTLKGNGTTSASVIGSGGAISPGNVSYVGETLTVGALTLNTASRPTIDTGDLLAVTGTLNVAGASPIILRGAFTTPTPLITYGSLAGSASNFSIHGGSAELSYSPVNDAANNRITFTSKTVTRHTRIVTEGMLVPGGGTDFFNNPFTTRACLNASGQVAFYSSTHSISTNTSIAGVFLGDGNSLITIARQNQAAPGAGGGTYNMGGSRPYDNPFFLVSLNNAGQVAFASPLVGTTDGSTDGVFRYDPGAGVSAIAREKQAIPGLPGQTLGPLLKYSTGNFYVMGPVNASGLVPFVAGINNAADGALQGVFVAGGPFLNTIARHKFPAPGAGGGTFGPDFTDGGNGTLPGINPAGQVAFLASLTGTSNLSTAGIFRGDGGTLAAIAREKDAAPGTGGGLIGDSFGPNGFQPPIPINDGGQVAFTATLTGTSNGSTAGVFRGDGSPLVAIARDKGAAPGTGGGTFGGGGSSTFGPPAMNNAGQVAFTSYLTGTTDNSDFGVFRGDGTSLVPIARAKQAAPNTGGGLFATPTAVAIAPGGQVSFVTSLTNMPDPSMNTGLFLGDGQEIILAALAGQTLPNSGQGVLRGFNLGWNAINQYGQVAYQSFHEFSGTGQYVFTPILHWRSASSGLWDTTSNWTIGLAPAQVHDVLIDPSTSLTVTGPASSLTVKSLQVGGGAGSAMLQLAPSGSIAVSNFLTVAAQGTLGGTGSITGAVLNNGTIAPGTSVGTLSVTGNVTDGTNSRWAIELSGTSADKLAVNGSIDLTAFDNLDITGAGSGTSWLIGTYTGSLIGAFDNVTSGYTVSYTGGNITLNAVPTCAPGDLNCDGHVDGGDYVYWRKNGLPASSYDNWRAHFGNPPGSGAGASSNAAVPEPTSWALFMFAAVATMAIGSKVDIG